MPLDLSFLPDQKDKKQRVDLSFLPDKEEGRGVDLSFLPDQPAAEPQEPSTMQRFAAGAADVLRKTIPSMAKAPIIPGQKIADVSESGRALESGIKGDIEQIISSPEAGSDIERAAIGSVFETALDFFPPTPEQQLANAAFSAILGFAGKTGLNLVAKKYPAFFDAVAKTMSKERHSVSPQVQGKLNYFISELKGKLGIPQERGLTVVDIRKSLAEGKMSPAQAARIDKAVYDDLLKERVLKEAEAPAIPVKEVEPSIPGKFELSEAEKRIFYQEPGTSNVFYEGIKLAPNKVKANSQSLVEISKIKNDLESFRDIAGTSIGKSAKGKLDQELAVARNSLSVFAKKNLPGKLDFYSQIKSTDLEELPKLAQRISDDFVNTIADPLQPPEPTIKGRPKIKAPPAEELVEVGGTIQDLEAKAKAKAKTGTTLPRIKVSPIAGVQPKNIDKIIADFGKGLKSGIIYGKLGRRAAGTYYPGSGAAVVRFSGDLDTTAHEMSHKLDDMFGIVSDWSKPGMVSPFDNELRQFWPYGSVTKSGPRSKLSYKRAEGVAEYVRAWMVNPQATEAQAPLFTKFIKSKLPKETWREIDKFSNDVRSFAGATAHEQVMANVRWTPPEDSILKKLAGGNIGKDFKLTLADKMTIALQDNLKMFMKSIDYVKGLKGVDKLLPANDPEVLARLYMGNMAKVEDILQNGMVDFQGKRIIQGGIGKWLGSLDKTTSKALEKEVQEVASFMIAQRTVEKAAKLERGRVSGIGGGIFSDVSVAKTRLDELQQNPVKYARIKQASEAYREHADALLRYMVDGGRMSKESYAWIKENNEYYVAMNRIMEVGPEDEIVDFRQRGGPGKKIGTIRDPVKRFTGSTRMIENPFSSLIDNTMKVVAEVDRNNVMRQFRDLLVNKRGMYEGSFADISQVGRRAKTGEKNTIPIYVDGKRELWQFQEDVYKALKGIEQGQYVLPGLVTILPRVLRSSITMAPPFAVRNFIRDTFERTIRSEVGSKLTDSFKGVTPMDLSNLKIFGGDQFGHYLKDKKSYVRAMKTAMDDIAQDKSSIIMNPKKMATLYKDMMASSEVRGRIAEYKRAHDYAKKFLKYDDYNAGLYAASQARGILDFAVSGNWISFVNQIIPFTNAAIQGLTANAKASFKNPKGVGARWASLVVLPTIAERLLNYMVDEERYRQLPAYRKDMFWNLPIGDKLISIPKPFELGVLASGVGRSVGRALGDKRPFDGYGGSLAKSFLPIDEAALGAPFRGLIQTMANYDFFRNKNIVPPHEAKLDLDLRRTSSASNLSQVLQRIAGVDARKIDFILRDQFGYMGKLAADLSDVPNKGIGKVVASQTGIISSYPVYAARDVQWVFDMASKRDILTNPRYKGLNIFLNQYFDEKNSDKKQELTDKILNYAKETRDLWEKNPKITENRKRKTRIRNETN